MKELIAKEKAKLDKNNSKMNTNSNIMIHSSQVSSISGVGQLASVMRNNNISKEKSGQSGAANDFEKSKELASFLGVSQA